MADSDLGGIQRMGSQLIDRMMGAGLLVGVIFILALVILVVGYIVRYRRQFNIRAEIWSSRSGGTLDKDSYKIINDMGGIIYNKATKSWWFRLRGHRVDLPTPPYEAFMVDANGKNMVKIWQKSHEEFFYLIPSSIEKTTLLRNESGKLMEYPVGNLSLKVMDGDVSYWNQLKKRDIKKMFNPESILMQVLQYAVPVFMFFMVVFLTYMITEHWGEFSEAAKALESAAATLERVTEMQAPMVG